MHFLTFCRYVLPLSLLLTGELVVYNSPGLIVSMTDINNSQYTTYLLDLSHYILLINWTEQGISKIKESSDRYNYFKASVEKAGGKLIGGYYTFGEYDVVIIIEAPNDEAVMSLMLKVGSAGNVRSKSLKAFTAEEGMKVIKDLP